jgi:hypothetical protein
MDTTSRAVCDVAFLIVRHKDGSSDGVLSHFFPDRVYRTAHAELFDEVDLPRQRGDTTEALVLTTIDPQSDSKDFTRLLKSIARHNKGNLPSIESVKSKAISPRPRSEVRFTQTQETGGFLQTVEIVNSQYNRGSYNKEFRKSIGKSGGSGRVRMHA